MKALVLAVLVAQAIGLAQSPRRLIALRDLTVPAERLPRGCAPSPAPSVRVDSNQVRTGLWAGLPIPTNPWAGVDKAIIAQIRERIEGPSRVPDGPPLSASDLARFRLHLADDVDEGYVAVYTQTGPTLVIVYASTLTAADRATIRDDLSPTNPRLLRIVVGPFLAAVSGDGGECFQAVGTYVKSLAN